MSLSVYDAGDDWRGITDPAERRRRQNRLNQRAKRQRKQAQGCPVYDTDNLAPQSKSNQGDHDNAQIVAVRSHRHLPGHGYQALLAMHSSTRCTIVELIQRYFSEDATTIIQAPSDKANLARLNLLVAISANANTLGISWTYLENGNSVSLFNCFGPRSVNDPDVLWEGSLPNNLQPTLLQRTVVHHPWIDGFPFAVMRDNIIRALAVNSIDEDEFCESMFIMDPGEGAVAPVTVWGPADDVRSWEFSPSFFARWAGLTANCPEALDITNQWRQRRGQRKLRLLLEQEV